MTDVHAVETHAGTTRIVFHIAVPAETLPGAGSRSLRLCVANSLRRLEDGTLAPVSILKPGAGTTADPGTISAGEVTALTNGSLVELVRDVGFPTPTSDAENAAYMDGEFARETGEELDRLRAKHIHTGKVRDVPGQGA